MEYNLKNCESLLYTWNLYNIVDRLYLNLKKQNHFPGEFRKKKKCIQGKCKDPLFETPILKKIRKC